MAQAAADHVASLDRPVAALYFPPLERAQESAEPFASGFDLVPEIDIRIIEPTNVFEGTQMRRSLMNPLNWWHLRQPASSQLGRAVHVDRRADAGGHGRGLAGGGRPVMSSWCRTRRRSGSPIFGSRVCLS